ncbi:MULTISPECIES: hypothetical protein [unclassified Pantoea]|uniref:hypothetical protein n=1 Tax=unclassified Pantoea TaxID=2630326 RepID=UPI00123206D4|nr:MULTISPECIES: hypothetical protein [unclassified Pantoea]KAA5959929.1 hypothetical protein F3I53_12330 [Pantoea sp. VH_16]KAA5968437.1 hypothetical protein F3I54_00415 [Pantoea sp. VH_18]KAA6004493.1 hypothetical protein F3I46_01410 [Pantoea sp. M_1]KAA6006981.1 hypothetical protein F3I45_02070 [Pantoea sp. F_7]KAA6015796.1 hypothetical protein F3I43_02070 [Pantoea sp. F_18]
MKKDIIIKKATSDGKVAITMFADPEVANEIVRLAKEAAIEVFDGGQIETLAKSATQADVLSRIQEMAEEMQKTKKSSVKEMSLTDRLIEKMKK